LLAEGPVEDLITELARYRHLIAPPAAETIIPMDQMQLML
jgi:hypothetical protein